MAEPQPTDEVADSARTPFHAAMPGGEQWLRAFLENTAVIAWMKDEDGRHVFLSDNYQRRFGVRFEEWQGKTDFDVWPRKIAEEFRRNDLAVLAGGRAVEVLEEATNPDGSRSWWLNHKFPFQDATGKRYVGGLGVDITDRKRAEDALRASEERYERAVNGANDGIWDWNPMTGDDYLSPRWKQLLGFEDDELPNRQDSFFDRVHPDDRTTVTEAIRAHFEERQPYEIELRLRCKNGEYRWFSSRGHAIRDEQGQPVRMAGSITDVTHRKLAETALRESEERLRAFLKNSAVIAWMKDADGRHVFLSENLQRRFELRFEDWQGKTDAELWPNEIAEAFRRNDLAVLAAGRAIEVLEEATNPDGSFSWWLSHKFPFQDATGKRYVGGLGVDVTYWKRIETALHESEERLRLALDAAEAGTWSWDVASNASKWDERYHALYGFRPQDPVSFEAWIGRVHPHDRERLLTRIQELMHPGAGDCWREEFRALLPLKGERWMAGLGQVCRDQDGRAVSFAGINIDVTDRKAAELALRDSEERLRLATEAAGIGTFIADYEADRVSFSPQVCAILGVPVGSETTVEEGFRYVHPGDVPRLHESVTAMYDPAGDGRGGIELRVVRPDGEVRWAVFRGQMQFRDTPTGRLPYRQIGVCIDITERKQAEQALRRLNEELEQRVADRTQTLREQHERLQAVLNNDFNSMITIDRQGVIETVNPATERMFGYTAAEMIGQNIKMLMPAPVSEEHNGYLRRYLETGQARIIGTGREVVARRKDGSTFPADLAVSEITHLGLFSGIIRDISDRNELQQQVLEISVNEQRRIGQELHDGTGQELTGLTLVAGSLVDLLNAVPEKEFEGQAVRVLDEAGFARMHAVATKLCQQLSAANRNVHQLSEGILPVQIDAEGLRSALEELAASTEGLQDITCRFDCPEPVTAVDATTATHLFRIAQEAVNNALRHSQAKEIRISLLQQEDQFVLEVCDNGVGIDATADPRLARPAGSHGMGLRIMEYRAGMIGGQFRIERGEKGGTSVRCTASRK